MMTQEKLDSMKLNATDGKLFMNIKFTKKSEINAYIFKGDGRHATESLIPDNKQVETDKTYQVGVDDNLLIIAYPNLNKDTEFSFKYWISAYKEPHHEEWYEFAGKTGEDIFMVLCGIAALLLVCIACVCCYCCTTNANNIHAKRVVARETKPNKSTE